MSRYQELTNHLFSLNQQSARRADLSEVLHLAEKIGNPHHTFPSVHIAGTNGKGSVAFKLSEVLKDNGYRVGLFTSPHLMTYRERFQISGQLISEERVVSGLEKLLPLAKEPKFFEITTLLAFDYFAGEEVDVAIIETGLGGRLDATNILMPLLTIITQIGMDHAEILGNSLDEIAREKGGIIKEGIPLVLGKEACYPSIFSIAHKKNAPTTFGGSSCTSIAKKALKLLPFAVEDFDQVRASPPCRYEKRGGIIYDVAHNPSALNRLFRRAKSEYPGKKIHVILGMAKDKDIEACLEVIKKYADHIALPPTTHPRLLPVEEFPCGQAMSYEEALQHAKKQKALPIVTGSFYLMSMLLPH